MQATAACAAAWACTVHWLQPLHLLYSTLQLWADRGWLDEAASVIGAMLAGLAV
jgi:hypothetical protein